MSQMVEPFLQHAPGKSMRAHPVELEQAQESVIGGEVLVKDVHPLHSVKVRLQVRVGEAEMTVGELLAARENEVLVLDRAVQDPVDLTLDGKVVARGQLVAVADGTFALRITELPVPLGI